MPLNAAIRKYLRTLQHDLKAGNATEHTHRPALEALIETLQPSIAATNEPKRIECGAPDYVVSKKKGGLTTEEGDKGK